MSIAELADFVTALTITDEGPSPASQPSKLFTSREEFQTGRNRHIPAGFTPAAVTVAEATRSIAAVYAASVSTSAPMPAAPTPVSAPPRPTPPPSTDWRRTREQKLAAATRDKIRTAAKDLDIPSTYREDDQAAVELLRGKLVAATGVFQGCKNALNQMRQESTEKAEALAELKALDARITFIGGALPPPPKETTPLVYDAGE